MSETRPTFAAVSAIRPSGAGRFDADVSPDWTIGGKPNGGYLLAMLGRAATAEVTHQHVLAISAHFLASPDPGPVQLEAEVLRGGRSASQVRARMFQGGHSCVEAIVTVGTLDEDVKPYWSGGVPDLAPLDRAQAVRIEGNSPSGLSLPIMSQVDLRIDPPSLGFATGQPSGRGELHGWLDLLGGESFDPYSLVYAVDSFPPATLDVEVTGWVPTLELTVYVRALPAHGPVRVLHRAGLVDGGRVDETCFVWDSTGRLVAHGTQLAGIRLG